MKKKVIGFDHWKGLGNFTKEDGPSYEYCGSVEGGWNPSEFKNTLDQLIDTFMKIHLFRKLQEFNWLMVI